MNDGLMDINVLLDRSSSMSSILTPTKRGFDEYINNLKENKVGDACLSLYQFDSPGSERWGNKDEPWLMTVYENKKLEEVPPLVLNPRGSTAYIRAGCEIIDRVGARLAAIPEPYRPGKVMFIIITDGEENSSGAEFPYGKLKERIERQRNVYGWQFVFIGAEENAVTAAANIGIPQGSALQYSNTQEGTNRLYKDLARHTSGKMALCSSEYAVQNSLFFDEQTREGQAAAK